MTLRIRPSSLLWGAFVALGGAALVLWLRQPEHPALTGLTAALLLLLALRLTLLARDWQAGRLPATRLLLPAVLLAEGLGLTMAGASPAATHVRFATAAGLEVLLLVLAVRTLRQTRSLPGQWPEDRIATAFAAFVPPRAAQLMSLELVMLGSAFQFLLGGYRQAAPGGFSHHREAALRAILPALPLMIPGDFLLTSTLLKGLAPWLSWVLHGSSIYAVLWLVGFYATLKTRPHQLREGQLELHLGLMKSVALPANQVLSATPLPTFDDDWARHAHMKGVEKLVAKGNTILELKLSSPVQVRGLLGLGRPTDRLAVSVDDPLVFLAALGRPCA
jgi:hypothetical protein